MQQQAMLEKNNKLSWQMETPCQIGANEEVIGVSRSGRVRKKSSKLLDFSSEEVEKRAEKKAKRSPKLVRSGLGRGRPPLSGRRLYDATTKTPIYTELDIEDEDDVDHYDRAPGGADDSDDEMNELVADLVEAESLGESKVRHSLYMTEKSNKRKMLKDGKVVTGKLERKDKGKSRYTAYSMWAREFRKTSKFSKNQDIDFSNAARRLGELWANVSNKEKGTWRRKAKVQATKAKARDKTTPSVAIPNTTIATNNSAGFLNRATTTRTRKLAAEREKTPVKTLPESSPELKRKRNNSYRSTGNNVTTVAVQSAGRSAGNLSASSQSSSSNARSSSPPTKLTVPTIEAIDAAAHLKLLGESLTIIGESLKEHDGQIASSGSLSVLLDSLLCSLGPLLCLTIHIPGLEKKPQLKENLSGTLDNIAYVMPGL